MPRTTYRAIVKRLLTWFEANARDLPWRRSRDPYAIWVSEVMLQQTQVKTVVAYWERWMSALPTVDALARTHPDKIHKLWEGLGYYTRARNLHRAARLICEEFSGRFPSEYDQVLKLPGIGRYTAGAICSIAFNQPKPILDGNVFRVLSRVFAVAGERRDKTVSEAIWGLAETLVVEASRATRCDKRSCSSFNQSLMELGALICLPKTPDCTACPINSLCRAYRENKIGNFPKPVTRPKTTGRFFVAFVAGKDGYFLVRKRPAGVVNGHLWEFPNIEVAHAPANGDLLSVHPVERSPGRETTLHDLAVAALGSAPTRLEHFLRVRHTITRYRIQLDVFTAPLKTRGNLRGESARWATLPVLRSLAFSSAHRKIVLGLDSLA